MLDYVIVIAVAVVGIAVVLYLFDSVSRVSAKQKKAQQVNAEIKQRVKQQQQRKPAASPAATTAVPAAPKEAGKKSGKSASPAAKPQQQQQQPAAPKKSKKELEAERKKQEEELDALVAREALRSNSGMRSEKLKVQTLESAREQNRAKKNKGNAVADDAKDVKPEFTEEQKAKEKAHGFKIVEEKKPEKLDAVAATSAGATNDGFRPAGRRASPKGAPKTEREELEAKLQSFLFNKKGGGRRRGDRDRDNYEPPVKTTTEGGAPAKQAVKPTAGVHLKQKITAAPENAWQDDREW